VRFSVIVVRGRVAFERLDRTTRNDAPAREPGRSELNAAPSDGPRPGTTTDRLWFTSSSSSAVNGVGTSGTFSTVGLPAWAFVLAFSVLPGVAEIRRRSRDKRRGQPAFEVVGERGAHPSGRQIWHRRRRKPRRFPRYSRTASLVQQRADRW
jgi:hypothetical protein